MNLTQIYLDTFIPEYPKIINGNFASVSRYVDVFYDGSLGILTKPLTTTGRIKGAKGEFVTIVVDNLVVKNQFTNLFDNNTTADYNFYKLYIDPAVQPRDPCLGPGYWPAEYPGIKYIDVNKPYYKIQNQAEPYVFVNSNLSQVIGIFLDPSLVSLTNQFQVILDPVMGTLFTADASAAGDPSIGTGFYVELIAVAFDPSYGTTWAQYKHGLPVVGTGGGGGGGIGGSGTLGFIPLFNSGTTLTNSPLEITGGSTLNTLAINVDGIITLTNKKITGVATPTNPTDAVNLAYTDPFATNTSVNTTLTQFIRSTSTGFGLYWNAGALDVSVNLVGITEPQMRAYVDPSLALKANISSLGVYATNVSIGLAGFAKNASLGLYATNSSVGLALGPFATNASVGLALGAYATNASVNTAGFAKQIYVDGSLAARDSSISWLFNNTLTTAALNPYATNASIGLAGFLKNADISSFATNASISLAGFTTDISINDALTQFIRSTSTGVTLYWNAGVLDVSAVPSTGPSFAYVDGSLFTRDSSIIWLFANKLGPADLGAYLTPYATITYVDGNFVTNVSVNNAFFNYYTSAQVDTLLLGYVTQAYVDGSLNDHELQILSLDNRVTILETSTGNCTFAYVDGSLATRDSSIILLFNRLSTTDTSLSILTSYWGITDASLAALTATSLGFATNVSIGLAGFAKNSSVNFLYGWQLSQDASIASLRGNISTINSQIGGINNKNAAQDASIIRMDASIDWLMSQTSGEITTLYFHDYVDGSLGARDLLIDDLYLLDFIRSSSTGNGLFWNASTGLLDVSVAGSGGGVSQAYVDGSLAVLRAMDASLDASINLLFGWQLSQDTSISALRSKDSSQDASIAALDTLTQKHDASIGFLFNWDLAKDASIIRIDSSLNDVVDIYSLLDASFGSVVSDISDVSTRVYHTETSIGILNSWNISQDASIDKLYGYVPKAGNGLKILSDGSIGLGGILTEETSIGLNSNSFSILGADNTHGIVIAANGDITIANQTPSGPLISLIGNILKLDAVGEGFDIDNAAGTIFTSLGHGGIKYASPYDSAYTSLSLVTKGDLDACIGAVTITINGSINVFPTFNGAGNIQNSYFKENSNQFTVANDTGDLVIASGLSQGNLIIKTIDNGFSDFYLDPRNGIINIGQNQTNAIIRLQAGGTSADINFYIQPAGTGKTRLYGELELPSISNASTNKVLYYDSSTYLVTWANAPVEGASSLATLTDVSVGTVDKSLIQYDSSSGKWVSTSPVDASLYFQQKILYNTPADSSAAGIAGNWSYDASYLYICTSTNLWGRVALSAF
jgi:hypothetical protein